MAIIVQQPVLSTLERREPACISQIEDDTTIPVPIVFEIEVVEGLAPMAKARLFGRQSLTQLG
jgi:hypothetical protein